METMIFKVGDEVSFNGQYEKTKDVYFSGLRRKEEIDPIWHGESTITRVLVAQPHSKFRVKEANYPYYLCEKMWEHGDEEIPVNAHPVPIHINEVIPYCKEWEGTVTNKIRDI